MASFVLPPAPTSDFLGIPPPPATAAPLHLLLRLFYPRFNLGGRRVHPVQSLAERALEFRLARLFIFLEHKRFECSRGNQYIQNVFCDLVV